MSLTLRLVSSISEVDPQAWCRCAGSHPFVQHSFLKALESSGAIGQKRGVVPRHALLYDQANNLIACAPGMLKWGTLREYGPEKSWLRLGVLEQYFSWPKYQLGIPYFPVVGPRILVNGNVALGSIQRDLLEALLLVAPQLGAKEAFNIMHVDKLSALSYQRLGALVSCEEHSVWINKKYENLREYLISIPRYKRYQFLKERRSAEAHGLQYNCFLGAQITDQMISDYYEGHRRVCARHGHQPWLPAETYHQIVKGMAESACLMGYFNTESRLVAGMLSLRDVKDGVLYMLQWSEAYKLRGVTMDLVCRRPIDFAIEHGIGKVDSGLATPHKAMRGWETQSAFHAHWFNDQRLKTLASNLL